MDAALRDATLTPMPLDQLSAIAFVLVVVGAFVAASAFERSYLARLRAALKGDPDVEVVDDAGFFPSFAVRTRASRRPARLRVSRRSSVERRTHWEFTAEAPRVWQRTTLKLMSSDALAGRFLAFEGLNAPTHDAALSSRMQLGGARPDVVRGLFSRPAVRDAAIALVDRWQLRTLVVDGRGAVTCSLEFNPARPVDAKGLLLALVEFVDVLEAAAEAAPELPAPGRAPALLEAAGGNSGAPVGVPVVVVERRS